MFRTFLWFCSLKRFKSAEQSLTDFLNGCIALFSCGIGINGVGFHIRIYSI